MDGQVRRPGLLLMGIAALAACGHSSPHLRLDTMAPWPNPDHVDERISAAGLSSASTEALTIHYHAHLDIFVNGKSEPVAPSIGREDRSLFSPLHTHATSGMIHIEAPHGRADHTRDPLHRVGGGYVRTRECVGGYCRPDTTIETYVDGQQTPQKPPSTIVLTKGEEIAIVIGSPPASIPSSWDCRTNIDPALETPFQCADFGP